jgi:hypothetical protein
MKRLKTRGTGGLAGGQDHKKSTSQDISGHVTNKPGAILQMDDFKDTLDNPGCRSCNQLKLMSMP